MAKNTIQIVPYIADHLDDVLNISMLAWAPVFPLMKNEIPDYVYSAFYPHGWERRQRSDIAAACADDETHNWLSITDSVVSGFVVVRIHQEDSMGEIYVIAVHPDYQRHGICEALLSFSFD